MFALSWTVILLWALALVCGALVLGLWYRRDEKKEDRKRAEIELAAKLQEARLVHLAEIVTDVAVSDWDGLYRHVRALADRAREPGALLELLVENFRWQLVQRAEDMVWREEMGRVVHRFEDAAKQVVEASPKPARARRKAA